MINRRTAYCGNCNSNVVHVRVFQRWITYALDKVTFSLAGWLGIGPWQCVDCGHRNMTLVRKRKSVRVVSDNVESVDTSQAVGNFIRTEHALAHAVTDASRYSGKYRMGIVEKLLDGKSTVSRTCHELGVSELEIQRWIKEYMQIQLKKVSKLEAGSMIPAETAGLEKPEPVDWSPEELAGAVIESTAVRKPGKHQDTLGKRIGS